MATNTDPCLRLPKFPDCDCESCDASRLIIRQQAAIAKLKRRRDELLEAAKDALGLIEMLSPHGPSVKAALRAAIKNATEAA